MKILRASLALLVGIGAAGCDDGTSPDAELGDLNLAVAAVAAEATLDDVRSMALGTWGMGAAEVAAVGRGPVGSGPRDGLAPGDHLERSRTITYYDVDGREMEAYDALRTGSISFVIDVEGSLERPMWSGEVERHRDVTVSGLAGEETRRTWNGTGSDEHSRVRTADEGDMERRFRSQTTIEDVVVGIPRSENPWPLSGAITRHVEVSVLNGPRGDLTRERTVVVTFDGTRYVTLTVDGEEFEVDLAERRGRRPHRRGRG